MVKRLLSMVLCIAMLVTAVPAQVFASEAETAAETTTPEETGTAPETVPETTAAEETEAAAAPAETVPETTGAAETRVEEEFPAVTQETILEETEEGASREAVYSVVDSGTCGDNLTWELDEAGMLTISGTGPMYDYFTYGGIEEYPPWYKNDELIRNERIKKVVLEKGITKIGKVAFTGCVKLTEVEIPAGVTFIGDYAFSGCENLVDISIANTVTKIGNFAFSDCTSLENISLPESLSSLYTGAFQGCTSLKTVSLSQNFRYIGNQAFYGCVNLTDIELPYGIDSVNEYAFYRCEKLQSIRLPETVTWLGTEAFEGCTSLNEIFFVGDAPDMETGIFKGVTAKVYYPEENSTWTTSVRQQYGGRITWIASDPLALHKTVTIPGKAPTCTEDGQSDYIYCALCNEIFSQSEVIPATGHSEVIDAYLPPTCTQTGLTEGKHCSQCDELLVIQEIIPATGHSVVTVPAVAVTCVRSGLTEGSHCETCGEVFVAQEVIPANGHSFEEGFCLVCGVPDKADYDIFSGKSITLKQIDPETGKPYTAKQISWSMDPVYSPYASVSAKGKLTAKKVVEKVRVEAVGTLLGGEEAQILVTVDIFPTVTHAEILEGEDVVNGKTVTMDFDEASRTFAVLAHPMDTQQNVTWTVSDAKKTAYAEYQINGSTLTVLNPTGKAGTVTVKATVNAGVKKTVSFKLSFADFAESVTITNTEETVIAGDSLQLTAAVTPEQVTKAGVTWKLKNAADKSVASISKTGLLKTKTVYRDTPVTVVATTKDGLKSAEYTVTVRPRDTGMLILTRNGENVTKAVLNIDLNTESVVSLAAVNLADGSQAENISWKSSNGKIATVEDGMVWIHGKGSVTVTAEEKDGKKVLRKATVTLKISALTSSVTIAEPEGGLEVASGKSITLKAACADGANKVTWSIENGSQYAKIAKNGKLTANQNITSAKAVTVRATAADGSKRYAEATVTIRPIAQGVQIYSEEGGRMLFSIRSSDSLWVRSNTTLEWAMNEAGTLQLSARVYPSYEEGSLRNAIQGVTWKSSGTKIAAVDSNGTVTCLKPGTVTITATAADGSGKKVSFKLKVIKKISSLSMEDQEVTGGRSLDLAKLLQIDPADATYKTFDWEITGGDGAAYASVSAKGVLKTKKVKTPVTVELKVTARDGSGLSDTFTVRIIP